MNLLRGCSKASSNGGGGERGLKYLFLTVVILISLFFIENVLAIPSIKFVDPTPDDSLVLMYNFDNISVLDEESTKVVDLSNAEGDIVLKEIPAKGKKKW